MRRWQSGQVLLALFFLLWVAGCTASPGQVYVKDGKQYGVTPWQTWRARWWDFYERASSYAAGEFWGEAMADFQAAIAQRQADQRRARTYGMHLIDYFPHRELGIVYHRLGRYADAVRELEASLRSVETAKAKFYLNRARQSLLEQTRGDTAVPRLVLASPRDGLLTNHFTVTVAGHATDDTYVSAITINGRAQFIELAEPRLAFSQAVALHDGANAIDLVAEDLAGRQAHTRLTVHLDRHGPLLSLDHVEVRETPLRRVHVQGLLTDQSGITRFVLAGSMVPLQLETVWEWRQEIPLPTGMVVLPFEAEDAAGNVTRGEIALELAADTPPGTREGRPTDLALPRWAFQSPGSVVADLPGWHAALPQVAQRHDRHPPVITLAGLADLETVFDDTIYLAGKVTDASAITAFTINGEALWRRQTQQLFFGQKFPLQEGANTFVLEAVDAAGNTTQRQVVVTRAVRQVNQVGARLQVALLPFEKKGETSVLAEAVYDSLFNILVQQRRFDVVERQRLEVILRELKLRDKLQQGALADPATAAATGKQIATAEGIVVGTVTQTPQALEVFARFVDVETAVVLAAEDVYGEELSLPSVKTLMEGLAWKVQRHFPLVEGVVLESVGKRLLTALTERHGVKRFMKLIVFRPGQEFLHPQTGRLLKRPDTILGEARVTAVTPELSEALVLTSAVPGDVQGSDMVITK